MFDLINLYVHVEKKIRIMTVSRSLISPQISGRAYIPGYQF